MRGLLWHRDGAMSAANALGSEGRGDGWDRIHTFLRRTKLAEKKNSTIQTSDATLKLWNVTTHLFSSPLDAIASGIDG